MHMHLACTYHLDMHMPKRGTIVGNGDIKQVGVADAGLADDCHMHLCSRNM